jgi:hypothetical protein
MERESPKYNRGGYTGETTAYQEPTPPDTKIVHQLMRIETTERHHTVRQVVTSTQRVMALMIL